jgi:hypothetical protein
MSILLSLFFRGALPSALSKRNRVLRAALYAAFPGRTASAKNFDEMRDVL